LRKKNHAEIPQMPIARQRVYAKVHLSNWPKVQKAHIVSACENFLASAHFRGREKTKVSAWNSVYDQGS